MSELQLAVEEVVRSITKAEEAKIRVLKSVEGGGAHESHMAYAEGIMAGLQMALEKMQNTEGVK